jgi:general stress protein YciG
LLEKNPRAGTRDFRRRSSHAKSKEEISMARQDDKSSHGQHSDPAKGQKGVSQEQVGSGKEHDPNNFANNPERAAAAGRKGGQHSHDRD